MLRFVNSQQNHFPDYSYLLKYQDTGRIYSIQEDPSKTLSKLMYRIPSDFNNAIYSGIQLDNDEFELVGFDAYDPDITCIKNRAPIIQIKRGAELLYTIPTTGMVYHIKSCIFHDFILFVYRNHIIKYTLSTGTHKTYSIRENFINNIHINIYTREIIIVTSRKSIISVYDFEFQFKRNIYNPVPVHLRDYVLTAIDPYRNIIIAYTPDQFTNQKKNLQVIIRMIRISDASIIGQGVYDCRPSTYMYIDINQSLLYFIDRKSVLCYSYE